MTSDETAAFANRPSVTPPPGETEAWETATREVGSLLDPEAVAVVGASNTEGKPGYALVENIRINGYDGAVYPINPKETEIQGLKAYPSIEDVPTDVDTALFVVPGHIIPDIVPSCAEKGVTSIVVVSAGFGEAVDADRQEMQAEIAEACRQHGIRAIGPNTTGMVSMKRDFVASFVPFPRWHDGNVALAAQTGIFAGVYMEELMAREVQKLGYNYSLALGNKMDLDETEFVKYAGQDDDVDVVQLHLECIRKPAEFFPAAGHVASSKPVVLLKTGRTPEGRAASRWHTASTPGPDDEVTNACRANGVVRADTVPEFMNYAKGFSYQPAPRGRNVAVLSLSGANAVMAADYVSDSMLDLASLSEETLETVKALVPDWQPVRNPIDQWLALPSGAREAQEVPLNAVLADDNVDAVVTIHLATDEPDFDGIGDVYRDAMADHPEKPVLSYVMGAEVKDGWIESMEGTGVPVYESAVEAIKTLEQMYWWRRYTDGEAAYDSSLPTRNDRVL
ncbi:acetate--CoA ligase family protein [Halogeometricum luteum]|uniref:acetate--CoA ligase (ADP-forming) n=1 Tax=Halogeometricum luteum TaxID=2950537 RepID=A0ABU2G3V8_9EURY|nr:CoA-binding protein [Halogeometricum sp. S3BR5-2]MDS0294909.1 CoA-binding protein [Halogeometricum sp. S3BR5-2]